MHVLPNVKTFDSLSEPTLNYLIIFSITLNLIRKYSQKQLLSIFKLQYCFKLLSFDYSTYLFDFALLKLDD